MSEREKQPHRHRALAVLAQLAGDVVDGGDVVGIEGVAQTEKVGQRTDAQQRRMAGQQRQQPTPRRDMQCQQGEARGGEGAPVESVQVRSGVGRHGRKCKSQPARSKPLVSMNCTTASSRPGLEVGHGVGSVGTHALGVGAHHVEVGAHMRSEVGFVDDEQVALGDAGAALARNFFAAGHVDDVDRQVAEFRAEGGGQVVTTGLDEHDVGIGKLLQHAVDRFEIDRGIFADGGVRAAAGLHAQNALGLQRPATVSRRWSSLV
jgi:hypothetical protein